MKSLLLATAAITLLAVPAMAQEPVGSIGLTYSDSQLEFGGLEAESDDFALDGVIAVPTFGNWTFTAAANATQSDDGTDDDTAFTGTAHLTTLVGSDLRVGGFVGASDFADETALTAGAEVQKYLGKATLTGVVAYTTADDSEIDAWSVGADAAFYVMPNLRLNAGLSYVKADAAGVDFDGVAYGVGAEYQIGGTPFSVTGGYSHAEVEDIDVDTLSVGLRYSFGGGLQARDRAGAALPGSGVIGLLGAL